MKNAWTEGRNTTTDMDTKECEMAVQFVNDNRLSLPLLSLLSNKTWVLMTKGTQKLSAPIWRNTFLGWPFSIILFKPKELPGASSSVVRWCTVLQTGGTRVWFTMRPLDFFRLLNPSSRTFGLGFTQPLTKVGTRNPLGGKARPARKTSKLTGSCKPTVCMIWKPTRATNCDEPLFLSRYRNELRATRQAFDFRQRQRIFLLSTASRLDVGPNQPLTSEYGVLFPRR
jgi:hypothetical protein